MERINVTKAYLPNQKRLIEYIDQIYESGQMTNYGPLVQTLERRLAQHLGVRHVVLVANGTLALQVAFKALKLQGSVITTPFSFPATTSALVWESLKPIFVDIDSLTWNLNPAHILDAVQSDTTAILPVHVFGNPCEVKAISDLAKELNLKVIYDAAHAFEVQYQSESVLKWGDLSILSFHATKLFHTIEGGALITENDELAEQLRSMINFGFGASGEWVGLGINAKLHEFSAAMGLSVLDELDHIHAGRRERVAFYERALKGTVTFQTHVPFSTRNDGYFPVLFKNEAQLKRVLDCLNERSIFPRRYFYPTLDKLPYIETSSDLPIARDISSRILCLPLHPELSLNVMHEICELIKSICPMAAAGEALLSGESNA